MCIHQNICDYIKESLCLCKVCLRVTSDKPIHTGRTTRRVTGASDNKRIVFALHCLCVQVTH